jgi:hypothetical protein
VPAGIESATERSEGADAATDGGVSTPDPASLAVPTPALLVLVVAGALVLALGLGSSVLTDWLTPVLEGWL